MNEAVAQIAAVALAIVGVASLAVLVSKNANTSGVISASGQAFSQALGVAVSPVTGATNQLGMNTFTGAAGTFPIG
jgi:hypothetical protein